MRKICFLIFAAACCALLVIGFTEGKRIVDLSLQIKEVSSSAKVKWSDLPKTHQQILLYVEDKFFFEDSGVNLTQLRKALRRSTELGIYSSCTPGASGIAMQIVKLMAVGDERTIYRKVRQVLFAVLIGTLVSKEDILNAYLSVASPANDRDFSDAAKSLYGKELPKLSPVKFFMLANLLRSPSRYPSIDGGCSFEQRRNFAHALMLAGVSSKLAASELENYTEICKLEFSQIPMH